MDTESIDISNETGELRRLLFLTALQRDAALKLLEETRQQLTLCEQTRRKVNRENTRLKERLSNLMKNGAAVISKLAADSLSDNQRTPAEEVSVTPPDICITGLSVENITIPSTTASQRGGNAIPKWVLNRLGPLGVLEALHKAYVSAWRHRQPSSRERA